jgi:hypothetical protein
MERKRWGITGLLALLGVIFSGGSPNFGSDKITARDVRDSPPGSVASMQRTFAGNLRDGTLVGTNLG